MNSLFRYFDAGAMIAAALVGIPVILPNKQHAYNGTASNEKQSLEVDA